MSYLGYILLNTKVSYELIYIKQTLFTLENLIKPHQQSMTGSDNKKEDRMVGIYMYVNIKNLLQKHTNFAAFLGQGNSRSTQAIMRNVDLLLN